MLKIVDKSILFYIYSAIVLLFSSWTIYYKLPYIPLFFLIHTILIFNRCAKVTKKRMSVFLSFLLISLWFYKPMNGISLYGILRSIHISSFFLLSRKDIRGIIKYIFAILAPIVALGVISHILFLIGLYPLGQVATVFTDNRYFDVYPCLVYQQGLYMRFNSIFDEPGYLGTIVALYLVLDNLDFKKPQNVVLLIGGFLTLSLAFYLMMAIAFSLKAIRNKSIMPFIYLSLLFLILYKFFPDLFEVFFSRQEFVGIASGEFTDSRGGAESAEYNLNIIHSRPWYNILVGNGNDSPLLYARDNTDGIANSSIYRLIFQMGYLGLASIIIFVLFNSQKRFYPFLFACLFLVSLYQRPEIFNGIYVIMLAAILKINEIE